MKSIDVLTDGQSKKWLLARKERLETQIAEWVGELQGAKLNDILLLSGNILQAARELSVIDVLLTHYKK